MQLTYLYFAGKLICISVYDFMMLMMMMMLTLQGL